MRTTLRYLVPVLASLATAPLLPVHAQEAKPEAQSTAPLPDGRDLASKLLAAQPASGYLRFKMVIEAEGAEQTVQVQLKQRRGGGKADVLAQVLFPKERKGEGVLLKLAGATRSGTSLTLPGTIKELSAANLDEKFFGSDLSYTDILESHFTWPHQKVVGGEVIDGVQCYILESRPASAGASSYALVRSWVDTQKLVTMRVEKYDGGATMVRRIDTLRVAKDGGHYLPASMAVRTPGSNSVTRLDGSRAPTATNYSDADFTKEALRTVSGAGSGD